jgi:hypothetical protein
MAKIGTRGVPSGWKRSKSAGRFESRVTRLRCAWRKDEDVLAEAEEDDVVSDWGDAASVVSGWGERVRRGRGGGRVEEEAEQLPEALLPAPLPPPRHAPRGVATPRRAGGCRCDVMCLCVSISCRVSRRLVMEPVYPN